MGRRACAIQTISSVPTSPAVIAGLEHAVQLIARAVAALGAANAVSAAVEGGRKPRARDLQELGIDPVSFGRVIR